MHGHWHRVTADELETAKGDFSRAMELVEASQPRSFSTDKAWQALDYLLERRGIPVGVVFGEQAMGQDDPDVEGGVGPLRFLTPPQVRQAALALARLSADDLVRGVD